MTPIKKPVLVSEREARYFLKMFQHKIKWKQIEEDQGTIRKKVLENTQRAKATEINRELRSLALLARFARPRQ